MVPAHTPSAGRACPTSSFGRASDAHEPARNICHPGRRAPARRAGTQELGAETEMTEPAMPLWEVFIRNRSGMPHKHCGSVHAPDAAMALQAARDVYTRRGESVSMWVVPSSAITASDPADKDELFEPTGSKIYRHPTFYKVPDDVGHM